MPKRGRERPRRGRERPGEDQKKPRKGSERPEEAQENRRYHSRCILMYWKYNGRHLEGTARKRERPEVQSTHASHVETFRRVEAPSRYILVDQS